MGLLKLDLFGERVDGEVPQIVWVDLQVRCFKSLLNFSLDFSPHPKVQ